MEKQQELPFDSPQNSQNYDDMIPAIKLNLDEENSANPEYQQSYEIMELNKNQIKSAHQSAEKSQFYRGLVSCRNSSQPHIQKFSENKERVEDRLYKYKEKYNAKIQRKKHEMYNEELNLCSSPMINPVSQKIVSGMNVIFFSKNEKIAKRAGRG